jgi:DNA polymerase-3 subunit epsilon
MRRLAVFDLETTGVDTETDRIVSAFFGILDEQGNLEEAHDYLVKQDQPIPEGATAVHGITTEYANEHGQDRNYVVDALLSHLQWCVSQRLPLAGHNIVYDLTLLDREAQREGFESVQLALESGLIVIDSLVIDKRIDTYRKGKRTLITAAEVYGVELSEDEAHGARADAIASGRVVQIQLADMEIVRYGPKMLMQMQKAWKAEQAASFQEYLRTKAPEPDPEAVVNGEWPLIPRSSE